MNERATFRTAVPAITAILLRDWDPIGVQDEPRAQESYDSHAVAIYGLLARDASADEVTEYLTDAAAGMGLAGVSRRPLPAIVAALRQCVASSTGS